MAQAMAEEGGRVPMSPGLQATLLRARDYAASQTQPQVLLEHLLLALTEDADAGHVLEVSQVDLARLRNDVAGYIGAMPERVPAGTPGAPAISTSLTQVLKYATLAAQQGRRPSIDGAIVLAALVGDGRSMAASFLKAQGLTFEAAIKALREASARPPSHLAEPPVRQLQHRQAQPERPRAPSPEAQPPYESPAASRAETLLAAARERIVSRAAQAPAASPIVRTEPGLRALPPAEPPLDAAVPEARPVQPPVDPQPLSHPQAVAAAPFVQPEGAFAGERPTAVALVPGSSPETGAAAVAAALPIPAPPPTLARIEAPSAVNAPASLPAAHLAPPASTWAPPPMAPRTGPPGPQAYRPAPPAGWTARPQQVPPVAPRGPFAERPGGVGAPWPEPSPNMQPSPPYQVPPADPRPTLADSSPHAQSPSIRAPAGPGGAGALVAPSRSPAIDQGQVVHNIPARMRQGRPQVIEVRVERPPLAGGGGGQRPHALRAETVVVRAIAVRLRSVSGRFIVDAGSPETQWDQGGGSGRLADEAAVWRFTVTPLSTGRAVLQLAVAARTMGADGVLAETQLPEDAVEVRSVADPLGVLRRIGKLALAAAAGMLLIKVLEGFSGFDLVALVRRLLP